MIARRQQSEMANQAWTATHPTANKTQAIITIPVVVHVVYNNSTENVSNAQVLSQIETLNQDFRLMNADSLPTNHPFWGNTADSEIEFCLATTDPNGNATTGITRTSTSHGPFLDPNLDDIKFTNLGGHDNWDPTHYLNLWVCDLGNSLYGYATFPSELATDPNYDGVVVNYTAFGNTGTVVSPSDLGRTATHEIGHWLNLSHIWGDQNCGDDLVADTEPAQDANYGCPSFPYNALSSCGSSANGEMYMNYMDYVDDNCMKMFTLGQKSRMRTALNGERSAMSGSAGCGGVTAVKDIQHSNVVTLSPNPSTGIVTVSAPDLKAKSTSIVVTNALGAEVQRYNAVQAFPFNLDLSQLASDLYFVRIANGNSLVTQKIMITH